MMTRNTRPESGEPLGAASLELVSSWTLNGLADDTIQGPDGTADISTVGPDDYAMPVGTYVLVWTERNGVHGRYWPPSPTSEHDAETWARVQVGAADDDTTDTGA